MSAAPWARGRLRGLLYRPPSHRPVPGRPHYRFRARRGPGALRLPGLADVTPGGFLLLIGGHDASSRPARLPIIEGSNRRAGTTVRSDKKKFPNDRWRYAPSHLPARRPSSELTANACFPLGRLDLVGCQRLTELDRNRDSAAAYDRAGDPLRVCGRREQGGRGSDVRRDEVRRAQIGANAYTLSGQGLVSTTAGSCEPPLSAYRIRTPSTVRKRRTSPWSPSRAARTTSAGPTQTR
jgi:hypothetical protein